MEFTGRVAVRAHKFSADTTTKKKKLNIVSNEPNIIRRRLARNSFAKFVNSMVVLFRGRIFAV